MIKSTYDPETHRYELEMDEPEGKGKVILEPGPFGPYIIFPDISPEPQALIDFYYKAIVEDGERPEDTDWAVPSMREVGEWPLASIVSYDQYSGNPVSVARFFKTRTLIELEPGVRKLAETRYEAVYGYPEGCAE